MTLLRRNLTRRMQQYGVAASQKYGRQRHNDASKRTLKYAHGA
jgi:hypothetical protein